LGWEKGQVENQVENQVGLVCERFFTPRLRFKSYDEMSAWLLDKCIAYAKAHRHPELTEQTIWECQLAWSSYSDRDWQPVQNNAFTGGTTGNATAGVSWSALDVATNTSAQIRSRLENSRADVILIIATLGWVDTRGK
jgi:hypothetical protein